MAKRERKQNLVVRMAPDELAKVHAIADASDKTLAEVVRELVESAYFDRFGKRKPPAPKLKFAPRSAQ